jgi:hypothetical protein
MDFAKAAWAKIVVSSKDPAFWTGALIAFIIGKLL